MSKSSFHFDINDNSEKKIISTRENLMESSRSLAFDQQWLSFQLTCKHHHGLNIFRTISLGAKKNDCEQ
jgi:hypothetical protein